MPETTRFTLGSLFDGIGGFPYAGSFFGIEPLWASEILPVAISVTKRHLPRMEHVGDVTKLDGSKLPPVDIITFGSPCQGLSLAGKRGGLADPRSGLFTEAIRVIREMREATNGEYPKYALWENVPGALSTAGGLDFKAVLEAFAESEVPFPRSGRWANAGLVRGRGFDLAWCLYDARHLGVAQRRRRIFLVMDFGAGRAGEILFKPKSLRGYFEAGGTPRQGPAAYAVRSPDGESGGTMSFACNQRDEARDLHDVAAALCAQPGMKMQTFVAENIDACSNCLSPWDTQQARVFTGDGVSATLAGADNGGGRNPAGLIMVPETKTAAFLGGAGAGARSIGYSETVSPTLKAGACSFMAPCLCAATGQPNAEVLENLSATLTCYHEQPIICEPELARTLMARGDSSPCADRGQNVVAVAVHQNQDGDVSTSPTAYTLSTQSNASARNAPLVAHPAVSGTLCASGAGLARPGGIKSETDLCIVIPDNDVIPIHDRATRGSGGGPTRNDDGCGNGLGVGKAGDPAPTLSTGDRHAVAVDCRNFCETKELSGTLQAKDSGGYSLNCQNPVRSGYTVRRLTPKECERLQGYPDGWTAFGHDGKPISDSARYMLCGNSIAVPCVAYILMGIAEALRRNR